MKREGWLAHWSVGTEKVRQPGVDFERKRRCAESAVGLAHERAVISI